MAELKWVVSTDPYFNRFPKATKPGVYFVPSEELEPHLKDAKELIKQGNSIRIKKYYDYQRKNKQETKALGLTVEDLIEEELAEAKECLKPGIIDGFFSSEVLIKKSLLKSIERKKANT